MQHTYPPSFNSKLDRFMWRMTDWMMLRYVRFGSIGVSVIVAFWCAAICYRSWVAGHWINFGINFVFGMANSFLAGLNFRRYRRDFWL